MKKFYQKGFSLIEVMVVVSIVAILAAFAIPGYQQMVTNARMTTQANEFLTMIQFTRSEAVKRNGRVTMCKSADGAACVTTGSWAQGWIVFANVANDGSVDAGDTVLRVHAALTGSSTLVSTAVPSYLSFGSSGQSAQAGTINLCSNKPAKYPGRQISLAITGRPSVAKSGVVPCV